MTKQEITIGKYTIKTNGEFVFFECDGEGKGIELNEAEKILEKIFKEVL